MIEIKPQFLAQDGECKFVVLTLNEYEAMRDALEDMDDLQFLRDSREAQRDEPTMTQDQVKDSLKNAG